MKGDAAFDLLHDLVDVPLSTVTELKCLNGSSHAGIVVRIPSRGTFEAGCART